MNKIYNGVLKISIDELERIVERCKSEARCRDKEGYVLIDFKEKRISQPSRYAEANSFWIY